MHTIVIDEVHSSHTQIKDEPKPSQSFLNKTFGVIQWRSVHDGCCSVAVIFTIFCLFLFRLRIPAVAAAADFTRSASPLIA
ncbi:Hypothetical predicted protein [Octopus vulgaris]|uniref:Uncharacterized protein n=1 Tax=Octopus vulgaris TaxID=6645 RepID=A0AA36BA61_OCTVU|nr:Hypothetical predicted protein [Octopus vulgaris]